MQLFWQRLKPAMQTESFLEDAIMLRNAARTQLPSVFTDRQMAGINQAIKGNGIQLSKLGIVKIII